MQLIEEECLYFRIEKIPPNIYKSYEIDCKKEAENLLKGTYLLYCLIVKRYTCCSLIIFTHPTQWGIVITLLPSLPASAISVQFWCLIFSKAAGVIWWSSSKLCFCLDRKSKFQNCCRHKQEAPMQCNMEHLFFNQLRLFSCTATESSSAPLYIPL